MCISLYHFDSIELFYEPGLSDENGGCRLERFQSVNTSFQHGLYAGTIRAS